MFRARIQFLPDRAEEFLPDGQLVSESEYFTIAELVEYVQEFSDAIESTLVYSIENGQIVDLADFTKS